MRRAELVMGIVMGTGKRVGVENYRVYCSAAHLKAHTKVHLSIVVVQIKLVMVMVLVVMVLVVMVAKEHWWGVFL